MNSAGPASTIPVRTIGPVAQRHLGTTEEGRIAAVFGAAFYVESRSRILCLGTSAIEPGPIALITAAHRGTDWRTLGLAAGHPVRLSATEIKVAGRVRFPLHGAMSWTPEPIAAAAESGAVARGVAALRAAALGAPGTDGLGAFIGADWKPEPSCPIKRAAAGPIADARRWLSGAFAGAETSRGTDIDWARPLTGLGVGLTPSGDDFLGGMMITLHALGHGGIARTLWFRLCAPAREATNAISFALLEAAADGLGSDSIHRALRAILAGDTAALRATLPRIGRIGHSSGWDAMAGLAMALDGWLRWQTAVNRRPRTHRDFGPAPASESVRCNSAGPGRDVRPGSTP